MRRVERTSQIGSVWSDAPRPTARQASSRFCTAGKTEP